MEVLYCYVATEYSVYNNQISLQSFLPVCNLRKWQSRQENLEFYYLALYFTRLK